MIGLYLKTDGKTNLESFKGDKYVTRLIRLVHSYSGTEVTSRRFGIGNVVKSLLNLRLEKLLKKL